MEREKTFNRFIIINLIIGILIIATYFIVQSAQFEEERYYKLLDGEWNFVEQQLLTPTSFEKLVSSEEVVTVELPESFKMHTGKVNNYGTYQRIIDIPPQLIGTTLAFKIPYQYGAYRLWVNEEEIVAAGQVAQKAAEHETAMVPQIGYFLPLEDELLITIQASSFNHIRGGLENTIEFGEASLINEKHMKSAIFNLFINGCIFIMGVFMVLFAWYNKREFLFLLFGTFAILISIRSLFTAPFYYIYLFPSMSWVAATRLEYILSISVSTLYLILLWKWHEQYFSKKLMIGSVSVAAIVFVLTLFTQPVFFQALFFKVFTVTIPIFFYLIYVVYKSLKAKMPMVKINLFGMFLIFLAFFNDFALGSNWYTGQPLMLPAVAIYVTIHVFLMSKEFADKKIQTERLNHELQLLNTELDQRVCERTEQLAVANEKLEELALKDGLTGVHNRHSFNEYLVNLFRVAQARKAPLALIMLDIDEFKLYNDTYGHVEGDFILKKIVEIIGNVLPDNSFFARYGGEEFVVLLPNTKKEQAFQTAEVARQAIERAHLTSKGSVRGYVTVSLGVAVMNHAQEFQSDLELIKAADQRLYEAKQKGRNRVVG